MSPVLISVLVLFGGIFLVISLLVFALERKKRKKSNDEASRLSDG